jgi:hypothetical protein
MFKGFLLVVTALLAAMPSVIVAASCGSRKLASLELKILPDGNVLVPVVFQGTAAYMYLEIGSVLTMVSQQAVDRFALHTSELPADFILAGAQQVRKSAAVSDIAIGEVHSPDNHFPVDPVSSTSSRYSSADIIGMLGVNLLWQMDIELDLSHKRFDLYSPNKCAEHAVYWTGHYEVVPLRRGPLGEFYFPMELDGRKIEASFSSGSSVTTLTTDVTKRVYGFDRDSPDVESVTDQEGHTSSQFRAMRMTASGLQVIDEKVRLLDPHKSTCRLMKKADAIGYENCFGVYPLRLGRSVLEKLHIYIATEENRLYFTTE